MLLSGYSYYKGMILNPQGYEVSDYEYAGRKLLELTDEEFFGGESRCWSDGLFYDILNGLERFRELIRKAEDDERAVAG
jgi:hypothetical protein